MADVRPDWRTVRRPDFRRRPTALAARPGRCPCGRDVLDAEPIVLLGGELVQDPDGARHVDLSGAEWHPQQCTDRRPA